MVLPDQAAGASEGWWEAEGRDHSIGKSVIPRRAAHLPCVAGHVGPDGQSFVMIKQSAQQFTPTKIKVALN